MTEIHIFNVAGVMLNGRNDSLEKGFRRDLAPRTLVTFAPIPAKLAMDSPAEAIARTGEAVDAFLRALPPARPDVRVLGAGRSFGGYMLLAALAADPRRFERFTHLVAVESPLAPDVEVSIPTLMPVLLPAARHYRERPVHAAAMVSALRDEHVAKTLTIGNTVDSVITPGSMKLPGVTRVVHWRPGMSASDTLGESNGRGLHVVLPALSPGFSLETAILPVSYRGHLTWGDEKHELILELIKTALRTPAPQGAARP